MMRSRNVLSESKSVSIYRRTVYTFTILSKLINDSATYCATAIATATKQHIVNLIVFGKSYRSGLHSNHSERCRQIDNVLSERAPTPAAGSLWHQVNTAIHTRSKCHARNSCIASSSSSWRHLVILLKTFCFLMLFAGVTALPPVIRIGEYFRWIK